VHLPCRLSQVPFDGPVSAVHVGYFNGEFKVNPTLSELQEAELDLVIASTGKAVAMIEAGAREVSEDIFNQAVKLGHEANQVINALQEEITAACGKPKEEAPSIEAPEEVVQAVEAILGNRLAEALELPSRQTALKPWKPSSLKSRKIWGMNIRLLK
jgi:polyribonucleotide nucleotidyltransferase